MKILRNTIVLIITVTGDLEDMANVFSSALKSMLCFMPSEYRLKSLVFYYKNNMCSRRNAKNIFKKRENTLF